MASKTLLKRRRHLCPKLELFQKLITKAKKHLPKFNQKRLEKAFGIAQEAHKEQFRESGEPYVCHPLEVALILTDYFADEDTLVAALLHDTIEDTQSITLDEIENQFGVAVRILVEGVTKIETLALSSKMQSGDLEKPHDIETIRKIFYESQQDMRVVIIKLADRLHNMQTLESVSDEQRRRKKTKETLEIFVPVAMRLGIWKMKNALEKHCLHHLFPKQEKEILQFLEHTKEEKKVLVKRIIKRLQKADINNYIEASYVYERSLYTLKKIADETPGLKVGKEVNIFFCANNEDQCYLILKLIHRLWKTRTSEEDHISNPRDNGYQAYHVNVVTDDGYKIQLRIGTIDMYMRSLYGVAYDIYQHHKNQRVSFLENFNAINRKTLYRPKDFLEATTSELLKEKVEVHSGKLNAFVPQGSTALDAVFYVFGKKALRTKKIFLNDQEVPFTKILKSKQVLKVRWHKDIVVDFDWLHKVKTSSARMLIQESLQEWNYEKKVLTGHYILQKEFDAHEKGRVNTLLKKDETLKKYFSVSKLKDLYALIGEGTVKPYDVYKVYFSGQSKNPILRVIDTIDNFFGRLLFKRHKEHIHLKVKGLIETRRSFLSHIDLMAEEFGIIINRSIVTQDSLQQVFVAKLRCSSTHESDFHGFWAQLEQQEGVLEVMNLLSLRKQCIFLFWSCLTLAIWIIYPFLAKHASTIVPSESLLLSKNHVLIISLLPLLIINYLLYSFIRDYFTQIRNSRWMIGLGILLNVITLLIFWRTMNLVVPTQKFLVLTLEVALPIGIFIFFSLLILIEYLSRTNTTLPEKPL